MAMDDGLDTVLSAVGLGKWQIPYIAMFCLVTWVLPVHLIGSTLLGAPVPYRCSYGNESSRSLHNATAWYNEPSYYNSKCLANGVLQKNYEDIHTPGRITDLTSCPVVEYDFTTFTATIITEWDLICDQEVLRPLFQMMFSIGAIIGTAVSGPFGDSYGRKRAVQVSSILCLLATLGMYFSPWYWSILVLRVIVGAACYCMLLPSYNLALETIPPQSRTYIGILIGLGFSIGVVGFSGIGFLIRDWRILMLVSSCCLIILIPLAFWMGESPRWLLQNGGEKKVALMMSEAAKANRGHINEDITAAIDNLKEISNKGTTNIQGNGSAKEYLRSNLDTCFVYFRSEPMRVIIVVTPIVWLLQNCLYLGIMLNANNFTSSNPFAYIAVSGAMDGTALILATPFTMKLGRRVSLFVCFALGGSFLMFDLAVPSDLWWISWILVMAALLLIAAALQINFLYTSEMFPTSVRSKGFAWAHFAGNTGYMIAPLITDLLSQVAWWSVGVTFGCAGLLACTLVPFLPETNNRPLPETILDVEERYLDNLLEKKRKKRNSIKKKQEEDGDAQEDANMPLT